MDNIITGRIYMLKSFKTNDIYIGSTIQTIKQRLSNHKADYKRCSQGKHHYNSCYEIVKHGDCYVELIKEVSCTKNQLLVLEGEEIIKNPRSINKRIAGHPQMYNSYNEYEKVRHDERLKDETYRKHKQQYASEYRINNLDYYYEKQKEWQNKNREHVNEYKRQWRLKQKEKIKI